jgi:hypothetical protein
MNYLIYIEHSAENLQFFLWYRDYVKRFNEAPASEVALAPQWTQALEEDTMNNIQKNVAKQVKKGPPTTMVIFKGTDFEKTFEAHMESRDPFLTPPPSATGDRDAASFWSRSQPTVSETQAQETFFAAGAKQPCKTYS